MVLSTIPGFKRFSASPIVRYSLLEETVRNPVSDSPTNHAETLVYALRVIRQMQIGKCLSLDGLCSVKVLTKDVVVLKNETVVVSCSVNGGPTESGLPI